MIGSAFYRNKGVSPTGIARAFWNNLRTGSTQGGSTITQQYVKEAYLTRERTLSRGELEDLTVERDNVAPSSPITATASAMPTSSIAGSQTGIVVSPAGGVYQAGTLSGNPLAMAAGCARACVSATANTDPKNECTSNPGQCRGDEVGRGVGPASVYVGKRRHGDLLHPRVRVAWIVNRTNGDWHV